MATFEINGQAAGNLIHRFLAGGDPTMALVDFLLSRDFNAEASLMVDRYLHAIERGTKPCISIKLRGQR